MGIHGTLGQLLAHAHLAPVEHARQKLGTGAHHVLAVVALLVVDGDGLRHLVAGDLHGAGDFREHRLALGLAGLEQLLNTRQTVGDVLAGNAAGVERTHCQLCAGLTDGLSGNDSDCLTHGNRITRGKVRAIALDAYAMLGLTGE